MGMLTWVLLGVVLGLASPFMVVHLQRRREAARAGVPGKVAPGPSVVRPRNPFAGVSVRPCAESPCAAVVALAHERFLAVRAPALPLPGCDRKQCGCRYIRHTDRRAKGDRRDEFAHFGGFQPKAGSDRRRRRDDRRNKSAH